MKKYISFFVAALALALTGCSRQSIQEEDLQEITLEAVMAENHPTKTVIQEGTTSVLWEANDEIKVFFNGVGSRFTNQYTEPSGTAMFSGVLNVVFGSNEGFSDDTPLWGLYPYRADATSDNVSVTTTLPAEQLGRAGSFAKGTNITLGKSNSLSMGFYNVCGGARFSVTQEGITKVVFESNDGSPMAGKIRVGFGDDQKPLVLEVTDAKSSIVVNAPSGGFVPGINYYAVMIPQTHVAGITITLYTATRKASRTISSPINVKRSIFGVINNVDSGLSEWEAYEMGTEGGGSRSGLYLGIIGFNDRLYSMPIARLDFMSLNGFTSFIDALTTKNATLLYYSVGESIDALSRAQYPDNLFNVSLVTFTDGLDQGSAMMIEDYPGDGEYLEVLNNRLTHTTVSGIPLTAYSIGLRGSDVTDVAMFRNNLKKLATSTSNAFEVSDMSTVNSRFQEIADQISQTQTTYSYDLGLTIAGQADGTRMRFTFDNISNASSSSCYIEGVFNLSSRSLLDVSYHGMTADSGASVKGEVDGVYVTFPFFGIMIGDGKSDALNKNYIKHWTYKTATSSWQINSEFNAENDANVTTTTTKKSAVVLLDLDCSTSLGSQFSTLKSHAKSFVQRLCEAADDPSELLAVDLGLSVKWASFNLGAAAPWEYGDYYAWGETGPKSNYSWSTYKWCNGDYNKLTKYCPTNKTDYWDGTGSPDGKAVLDLEDDAARANWGDTWRMPTDAEWTELRNNCTWTWTTQNGVNGRLVTSNINGNSIFLPAAGSRGNSDLNNAGSYGYYCSSSLYTDDPSGAWNVYFNSSSVGRYGIGYRYYGRSVRPVSE